MDAWLDKATRRTITNLENARKFIGLNFEPEDEVARMMTQLSDVENWLIRQLDMATNTEDK